MLKHDEEDLKTRTIFKLEHIKEMLEVCLYKSYFLWDDQIHSLEDSGPIGLSLMVVLAESFLQMIEKNALHISLNLPVPINPITHKRYVDDTHDRFHNKEKSEQFLKILNDQEPKIQFTAEYENEDKELSYLDLKIVNTNNGKYEFKIHRKDAITNIQIKPDSCHDDKIKEGVYKGYISRAKSICSPQYLEEEISFIKNVFVENGYDKGRLDKLAEDMNRQKKKKKTKDESSKYTSMPYIPGISQQLKNVFKKAGCKLSFKSPRNLCSILTTRNKPQLPPNSQPGVYFIPTECRKGYTGETKKRVTTRNTEHAKAVFKGDVEHDALAAHNQECNCETRWEDTKTIAIEPVWFRRKVRESLEIRRLKTGPDQQNGLNQDNGDYVTTNLWNCLFNQINRDKKSGVRTFESMTS